VIQRLQRDKDFLNFIARLFLDDILERILTYFSDFLFKRKFLATVRSPAKYSDASGLAKKDPTLDGLLRHKTRSVSKQTSSRRGKNINKWWVSPISWDRIRMWGTYSRRVAIPLIIIDNRQARSSFVCDKGSSGRNISFKSHSFLSLRTYINTQQYAFKKEHALISYIT